jgi:osmotically-inducible protein OsmY
MGAGSWTVGAVLIALVTPRGPASAPKAVDGYDDVEIKARVDEALTEDTMLIGDGIFARSVDNGHVHLGGKARTMSDQLRAVGDAARVPGVRRITSEIKSSDLPGTVEASDNRELQRTERQSDATSPAREVAIPSATERRVMADSTSPGLDIIKVDTHSGAVTLLGTVSLSEAKTAAERTVR